MSQERFSLPKAEIKILLLEGVNQSAIETFQNSGYTNIGSHSKALSESELIDAIKDVHILGIRSRTQITPAVIAKADRLMAVGCFCIGTNQVDLNSTQKAGIPVFNAPFSNTRSVAELTIANIIGLMRGLGEKNILAHQGKWLKTSSGFNEVREKTLGIVGYGRIGTQVSVLAEALGMKVIFYDPVKRLPMGNAKPTKNLAELLSAADVVTLHVPGAPDTKDMIKKAQISQMKRGAKLINTSRGNVVDIGAVTKALKSGQLGGAAFDVYPQEPASNDEPFESELRQFNNVVLSPHIGSGTEEAQFNIGVEVAGKLITYSDNGSTTMAVNFPEVELPSHSGMHRLLHIHSNKPGVLSDLNEIFANNGANIAAQYLQTDAEIGYVVTDIDKTNSSITPKVLQAIPWTIKTRILY